MVAVKAIIFGLLLLAGPVSAGEWVTLVGEWRFALDPQGAGIEQKWYQQPLGDKIRLPGTTDDNGKGPLNEARLTDHLTRLHPYVGAAWYQRDLDVPAAWNGKRLALVLERTKPSQLWLDGQPVGQQDSLVAPHLYELGQLPAGRHQLTLRIDNSKYPPIGDPHQVSEHTQTNWNGVIGKVGLRVTDWVWMDDVQVYPDVAGHKLRVRVSIANPAAGSLTLSVDGGKPLAVPISGAVVEAEVPLAAGAALWDEFHPALHKLTANLVSGPSRDTAGISFGLREFKAQDKQFQVNGRTTFLRGKHDACVFPLTGYPPMTVDRWLEVFRTAKQYGINHYRFHTWTPPDAAFEAADQLGIYLQPELPNWKEFGDPKHDEFERAEGERILRAFGNHPSFVMLSLGNELGGKQELMAPFVQHFRSLDGRHLYAQGTNNWFPAVYPGDDYWASFQVKGKKIRGSFGTVDAPLGHVQAGPPSTRKDYSAEIAGYPVPVVSHEIGEYQVYPDYSEIPKYTGVLRARNFEVFRERLDKAGMLDQANDFVKASGALAVLCYREDIEAALRTRGFAGLQLLDLQDFPGQGTALVGILNAFMESKGLIEPAKWRRFLSETVPLLRFDKYTWTTAETFIASGQVAHYGPAAIGNAVPVWTLRDAHGQTVASGRLKPASVPQGSLTDLGEVRIPLAKVAAPAKLTLELAIAGSTAKNSYDLWVYPEKAETAPGKVLVARKLDEAARQALASGGKVLLLPEPASLPKSIEGSFASDFWNWGMFRQIAEERHKPVAPGTIGILCDPQHPALAGFPTDFHSNWQWFHLLMNSRAVILDPLPKSYRPVVQVIDNLERVHKLGAVFEVKMGGGKLLVCSIDLPGQQDKPEARQLLHSLLAYMNSGQFAPLTEVDEATLGRVLQ